MWILLAVVLKASSPGSNVPVLDKPLVYNTLEICEASMKDLYDEYKKLAPSVISKYGGKYIARGGRKEIL